MTKSTSNLPEPVYGICVCHAGVGFFLSVEAAEAHPAKVVMPQQVARDFRAQGQQWMAEVAR